MDENRRNPGVGQFQNYFRNHFFVLFVPVGLIRRIANRDTLKRSLDYTSNSYWIIPQKKRK